jgi:hypothetical protein
MGHQYKGRLVALLAKDKSRRFTKMADTPAYYHTIIVTSVKGFIVKAPMAEAVFTILNFLLNLGMGPIS